MVDYTRRVEESYCSGTFRHGPLLQVSMVGQFSEESGGYFPQLLGMVGGERSTTRLRGVLHVHLYRV